MGITKGSSKKDNDAQYELQNLLNESSTDSDKEDADEEEEDDEDEEDLEAGVVDINVNEWMDDIEAARA